MSSIFAAEHAALRVQLLDEHLGALRRGIAEERGRPEQRHGHADLDRLSGPARCEGAAATSASSMVEDPR
jgi:hypothetical protein